MRAGPHGLDEPVEQRRHVVRSRAGLRMPLEAEGRRVGQLEALVGSVEQRAVGDAGVGRQRGFVDREAVVLRRSEEHTSELQSLMRISYAVFCLQQNTPRDQPRSHNSHNISAITPLTTLT